MERNQNIVSSLNAAITVMRNACEEAARAVAAGPDGDAVHRVTQALAWGVAEANNHIEDAKQAAVKYGVPEVSYSASANAADIDTLVARVKDLISPKNTTPTHAIPCPFPCGWEVMHKIWFREGAMLARGLEEGEPVTESQRGSVMRLIAYGREMLAAIAKTKQTPPPKHEMQMIERNARWAWAFDLHATPALRQAESDPNFRLCLRKMLQQADGFIIAGKKLDDDACRAIFFSSTNPGFTWRNDESVAACFAMMRELVRINA